MMWWAAEGGPSARRESLIELIGMLATSGFADGLLAALRTALPANSLSVYSVAANRRPKRFMAASRRSPDMTADCWRAYVDGPCRDDTTLTRFNEALPMKQAAICHITAEDVSPEHRLRVYQAHRMAERVSIVCREADHSVFALNCYRHEADRPFSMEQVASFAAVAPALLALTRKQVQLLPPAHQRDGLDSRNERANGYRGWLYEEYPELTTRELDVCERLLRGIPQEGIAADLGLKLPTVKTYRNRAFQRMGIHFRSELFALALRAGLRP